MEGLDSFLVHWSSQSQWQSDSGVRLGGCSVVASCDQVGLLPSGSEWAASAPGSSSDTVGGSLGTYGGTKILLPKPPLQNRWLFFLGTFGLSLDFTVNTFLFFSDYGGKKGLTHGQGLSTQSINPCKVTI